jgi:hypothetical protein
MTLPLLEKQQKSNHRYAMQPIVLNNKQIVGDYYNGLTPTTQLKENLGNLGVLGSTTLLSTAIGQITGIGKCLNKVLKRF